MSTNTGSGTWTIRIHDSPVDPGMYVTRPERDSEEVYLLPDEAYANLRADLQDSNDPHIVGVLQAVDVLLGLRRSHIQAVRLMAQQIDSINLIDEQ